MSEISSVKAGEVWYSMQADTHFGVLTDGELGCYAQEVQQRLGTGEWEAVPHEPRIWITTAKLTQLGWLAGTWAQQ